MEYEKPIIKNYDTSRWFFGKSDNTNRLDGPAVEYYNGYVSWWVNGNRHRKNGSAIEWDNETALCYFFKNAVISFIEQEQTFNNETLKLGSITQFIDFVARCDILLL